MNSNAEFWSVVGDVIASPRLTAVTAGATTTFSAYNFGDVLQSGLSITGVMAGIAATILLSRVHWIKYKNEVITNKLLTAQLNAMGAEPITEKIP